MKVITKFRILTKHPKKDLDGKGKAAIRTWLQRRRVNGTWEDIKAFTGRDGQSDAEKYLKDYWDSLLSYEIREQR